MVTALNFNLDGAQKSTGLKFSGTTTITQQSPKVIPMVSKDDQKETLTKVQLPAKKAAYLMPMISIAAQSTAKTDETKKTAKKPPEGASYGFNQEAGRIRRAPGIHNTPTLSGGVVERVFNGYGQCVKETRYDKNGDVVETAKTEYTDDEEGNVKTYTTTYYDSKGNKCGSHEHIKETNEDIYRDKNGKILCRAVYNPDTYSYTYYDANGKVLSEEEGHKRAGSVRPFNDKKYRQFINDELDAGH